MVKIKPKLLLVLSIAVLLTAIATVQALVLPLKTFEAGGILYTEYNNYIIFKQSFFHLIHNQDLYQLFPKEQWDLFKYSPTFALLMGLLAYFTNWVGLFIWNLLNSAILIISIWKLPFKNDAKRLYAITFIVIELVTSIQNSQSNGLIAGMIIFAFLAIEHEKIWLASLLIVGTVFIKLFGVVALGLFFLYPGKFKAALYTILWFVILGLLPLIVITPQQLVILYKSWGQLLKNDQLINYGLSVMGWLFTWFNLIVNKSYVVILGAIVFCMPFLRFGYFREMRFRLLYLSSVLIWVIIFNHRAESPTFIIAAVGIAIWYFSKNEVKLIDRVLLLFAFVFTILSATDIFPTAVKRHFLEPYVMKAMPCIFIWFKILWEQMFYPSEKGLTKPDRSYDLNLQEGR